MFFNIYRLYFIKKDKLILREICKEFKVGRSYVANKAYVSDLSLQNEVKGCPKVV